MRKFKIGDRVVACGSYYTGFGEGSKYNLPRTEGIIVGIDSPDYSYSSNYSITIDYNGEISPPVNPNCFKLVTTPIPLYSEEQAVSFLREKGYEVKAPPEPLKGKVYIYNFPQLMGGKNSVHALTANEFAKNDWAAKPNVIAIVDWTEGQGI